MNIKKYPDCFECGGSLFYDRKRDLFGCIKCKALWNEKELTAPAQGKKGKGV